MLFYKTVLIFGLTLIPGVISIGVSLGLCDPWRFSCDCGSHKDYPVRFKLEQCTFFYQFKPMCKPCDAELEPKTFCKRFQFCETCQNGEKDKCLTCPRNRYGPLCNSVCKCQNGASCDSRGQCKCIHGYEGDLCERSIGCRPPLIAPPLRESRIPASQPIFIEYSCPPNMELQGVDRISCLSTNEWSHRPPTCRVTCPPATPPHGGTVSTEHQRVSIGETVSYSCHQGYQLFGQARRTCRSDGTLDGENPRCEVVVQCPEPQTSPRTSRRIKYPFQKEEGDDEVHFWNGTVVTHRCDDDLYMLGDPIMTCSNNGTWSNSSPICMKVSDVQVGCNTTGKDVSSDVGLIVRIQCPSGCSLNNASVWGTVIYNDGSSVCRAGVHSGKVHNIGGPLYLVNNGPYSDFLGSTMNAVASESKLQPGMSFRFHNDPRTKIPDLEQLRQGCPQGWKEVEGVCTISTSRSKAWAMARNICANMGSKLPSSEDQSFLKALRHQNEAETFETWLLSPEDSGTLQIVLETETNETEVVSAEDITETGCWLALVDEEIVFEKRSCEEVNNFVCLYSLTDNNEDRCEDLGALENGFADVEGDGFQIGTVIKYRCKELYYLSGQETSVCSENSTWSTPKPRCIKVGSCLAPPTPKYGVLEILSPLEVNANSARISATRSRMARPLGVRGSRAGVVPPGTNVTEAGPSETAQANPQRKGFRDIKLPEGHYHVGTRATYSCISRYYKLVGSQTRRCQEDGTYSGRSATCLPVCGRSDSPRTPFIVNGNSTDVGQWPWQVAISRWMTEYKTWFLLCGGALLNEQWVITAAHCITSPNAEVLDPKEFRFRVGKYHRDNALDDEMVQERRAKEMHVHPYYDPVVYDADIALIQLDEPVELTTRVQPVCLPTERSTRQNIVHGKQGVVTGWGLTESDEYSESLRQAVLPVVGHEECEKGYETAGLPLTVSENMFCAGYAKGSSDACNGDSGGPMVFPAEEGQSVGRRWILEGVVSWGSPTGCGNAHQYGGFTRVSKFLDWIFEFI